MSCGKANIQSANPPSHPEPNISPISKLHEPKEHTEKEPRKQQEQSSFKEHSLRLSELPDWIKGENGLREANSIALKPPCSDNRRAIEDNTAIVASIEKLAWWARTVAAIVAEATAWTWHSQPFRTTQKFNLEKLKWDVGFSRFKAPTLRNW